MLEDCRILQLIYIVGLHSDQVCILHMAPLCNSSLLHDRYTHHMWNVENPCDITGGWEVEDPVL